MDHGQRAGDDEAIAPGSAFAHAQIEQLRQAGAALRAAGNLHGAAQAFARIALLAPDEWLAQYNAGAVCLEAGQLDRAADLLGRAIRLHAGVEAWRLYAHVQALLGNMSAARDAYAGAVALAPRDVAAHWGLFEVLQLLDDNAAALEHQRLALRERPLFSIQARVQPPRLTILELCIAGTFQANIPLDFILDADGITVHKLYVGEHRVPDDLPPYDLVFNTIADAPNAAGPLEEASRFIERQARPSLNAPELVPLTSRPSVAGLFADSPHVAVAATLRAHRTDVMFRHPAFPFLIRPLDSHAGNDLAKIDTPADLTAYLAATAHADDFYLTEFIEYRNADGYYRKYRIVFVDGVAYPVHLAISPRWMIHYYNAEMAENAWMRDEEHAFMRDLSTVFDGPRADGLREIAGAIPLDYFGIDCSIAPDGRVLLFEASTAMIVHMRDPVDLYPYKVRYVPRIIDALEALFARRLASGVTA